METRKVQKTGKSTLIVSLPKKWANENAVNNGSLLFLSQNQNGDLLLSTDRSEQNLVVRLDIGSKCGDPLIRDVIACYIAGYKTVEVISNQLNAIQKRDLHTIVNKLIGPEILEETSNRVVIQDLLSSEEMQPDRALKRIKNMTRSMVQDALSALITRNQELAMDVIQRDNEVDRLNLLIARQFAEILRSGPIKQEALCPICAFNYMQAATNLERMADHASEIAEISSQVDYELSAEAAQELTQLGPTFANLLDDCMAVLLNPDSSKANQLIDRTQKIKNQSLFTTRDFRDMYNDKMQIRLISSGCIERMLDHIINIVELAINLRNASLKS